MKPLPLAAAVVLCGALAVRRRRVPPVLAAAVLLAAAALAVYAAGIVPLPDVEAAIRSLGPGLGAWTYLLVGGLAFLESGALIGLVAPGEFAVIFGGFVAGQGVVDPFVLGAVVSGSAAAGDVTSFVVGRRLGRGFLERHGRRIGLDPPRLRSLDAFYATHGGKTIILGRFVGFARALSPFVAGTSRMRASRFLASDLPAAVIWSATFVALGFVFWESYDRALALVRRGNLALGAVVAIAVGVVLAVRRSRQARARAAARSSSTSGSSLDS